MKKALYILAFLSLVTWILGTFVFKAGTVIHTFLIIAAITCIQGVIICPKPQTMVRS
jgi:hypothetical protein